MAHYLHPFSLSSVPDYVRDLPIVALYSLSIYVFLIVAFRYIGRRQLGQLNVVDLVIIIIMGSAVETAMVHGNLSLPAGLVSAASLLIANRIINVLAHRSRWFRRIVSPGPVLLVTRGQVIEEHARKSGLTHDDVLQAIRQRGYCDIADVKFAVMEEDGEINVVSNSTHAEHIHGIKDAIVPLPQPSTPIKEDQDRV